MSIGDAYEVCHRGRLVLFFRGREHAPLKGEVVDPRVSGCQIDGVSHHSLKGPHTRGESSKNRDNPSRPDIGDNKVYADCEPEAFPRVFSQFRRT